MARTILLMSLVAVATMAQTQISTCQQIYASGSYVLTADLNTRTFEPMGACLYIQAPSVTLDCQNHIIRSDRLTTIYDGIHLESSPNFAIKNCHVYAANNAGSILTLQINNSSGTQANKSSITNSVFSGGNVQLHDTNHVSITNNSTSYSVFYVARANLPRVEDVWFVGNSITGRADNLWYNSGTIFFDGPTYMAVVQSNTLHGQWLYEMYSYPYTGAENGIIAMNGCEQCYFDGNLMDRFWHAGIEVSGPWKNSSASYNYIQNTKTACITDGWGTSLTNVRIDWNQCNESALAPYAYLQYNPAFGLFRYYPDGYTDSQPHYFYNNSIQNNTFVRTGNYSYDLIVDLTTANNPIVGGSVVANNTFSPGAGAAVILPVNAVTDGGNNVCQWSWSQQYPPYPVTCH